MSAIDPLKRNPARRRLRALPRTADVHTGQPGDGAPDREPILKCTYRPPDADFFCWKFGVWYNLRDCCYRHALRTFDGCADCGQGASNLKARRQRINAVRAMLCRSYAR